MAIMPLVGDCAETAQGYRVVGDCAETAQGYRGGLCGALGCSQGCCKHHAKVQKFSGVWIESETYLSMK